MPLAWFAWAAISFPGAGKSLLYQIKRKTPKAIKTISPKNASFASVPYKTILGVF